MKLVVDENMPYVPQLFAHLGEIVAVNGRKLDAATVADADILLVRSVTKVNEALLRDNHKLQFVGSATIGTDHVDLDYLAARNIPFSNAPGCNATSVGEYVFIALLELAAKYGTSLKQRTVGIVGAGNTGTAVAKCLSAYGVTTLLCDPPKARQGDNRRLYPLETLLQECDVITLHVPLTETSVDATHHLLDAQRLQALKPGCWLINASRGEVIDNQALIRVKHQRPDIALALDVWEGEPNPISELVALADFATPHIAGYSLEGRARGTLMLYAKLQQMLGLAQTQTLADLLPMRWNRRLEINAAPTESELLALCRFVYDLRDDDRQFRKIHQIPGEFDNMRKNHRHRREFSALALENLSGSGVDWLFELGFSGVHR
ncbi:4-phosphoerythronate dehydrogenase [Shewanella sp.]|jgi:erythronate-4-phosphate dehydrogenase|uniref:4-phosphoerythronate dehydrogenase n=1 Tax=Shewanella sp. TaxID=50422 RepID=UPI003D0C62F5